MPKYQKFLVAPLKSGAQDNVKPWLISTDAYSTLTNLYTWRGSVKKRVGGTLMNTSVGAPQDQLLSRFRINIGTTDESGNLTVAPVPGALFKVGQSFSCGNEIFTVNALGTPANMLDTFNPPATTATFNTSNGHLVLVGATPTTPVYYYPSTPVMGFGNYEQLGENNAIIFGFDQQFAYNFSYNTGWNRVNNATPGQADTWTGLDSDFFWTCSYRGTDANQFLLFITNNVVADGFRYWNGNNPTRDFFQLGTVGTTPINAANDFIITAQIILPFKGRLLLFNVTENVATNVVTFQNRVRYSQVGSPIETTSWIEDTANKGGFLDAPIVDSIISAQYLKDRLIVFFEYSTWELVYTGNESQPFIFQKINTELGVESLNSVIPFDQIVLGFGPNGINECNGINVNRVDDLIPYEIFNITNDNFGPQRVYGIRDYYLEVAYWAYNSIEGQTGSNNIYPNTILVYDYKQGTWAKNIDSVTAFGNFYLQKTITWADSEITWEDQQSLWSETSVSDKFLSIVAGNQEGYTFIVDSDNSHNSKALQITDMTISDNQITITAINHNLTNGSYIYLTDIVCFNGTLNTINNFIFQVSTIDNNTFTISTGTNVLTGTYSGGGVITIVSNMLLQSKEYNFFNSTGMNTAMYRVDYYVDKTDNGEMQVEWFESSSNVPFASSSFQQGTLIGTSILQTSPNALTPLESTQKRFWRPLYFNGNGENFSFLLFLNDSQITVPAIAFSDFQLNAFVVYAMQTSEFGS